METKATLFYCERFKVISSSKHSNASSLSHSAIRPQRSHPRLCEIRSEVELEGGRIRHLVQVSNTRMMLDANVLQWSHPGVCLFPASVVLSAPACLCTETSTPSAIMQLPVVSHNQFFKNPFLILGKFVCARCVTSELLHVLSSPAVCS